MHVLDYLADPTCDRKPPRSLDAEYRLLCSGTLHHGWPGDYSKSENARVLLYEPLLLFVVSRPFDDYPLELALHLTVPEVNDEVPTKHGKSLHIYYPDEEVVRDLAALLSLRCRRLITVAGKVSERCSDYRHPLFDRQPLPLPLATSMRRIFWRPHPLTVLTSYEGQEIQDYNPRPKQLDPSKLTELLLGLPGLPHAESLVASCRLYALALELIHERPDIAYQMLISSVETIANASLRTFQPADDLKVEHQKVVYEMAVSLGLGEETARKLAIEACRREWWATKKFKKFLIDNVPESIWEEPDELFSRMDQELMPKREDFERSLSKIYNARSKATHEGRSFPASASYTGGPTISMPAAAGLFGAASPFPPVVWFERVVNNALCGFWERTMPSKSSPPSGLPRSTTGPVTNPNAPPKDLSETAS